MCDATFKSKDSREEGVVVRMERHMRSKHGIEVTCWASDSVGGFCRSCFLRVPPGQILPHWRSDHALDSFAPFDHCINPFTQIYNRQLVSGGLGIELTWLLQAYGQDDWNRSTDDLFAFSL